MESKGTTPLEREHPRRQMLPRQQSKRTNVCGLDVCQSVYGGEVFPCLGSSSVRRVQWVEKQRGGGRRQLQQLPRGRRAPGELVMEHREDVDSF